MKLQPIYGCASFVLMNSPWAETYRDGTKGMCHVRVRVPTGGGRDGWKKRAKERPRKAVCCNVCLTHLSASILTGL